MASPYFDITTRPTIVAATVAALRAMTADNLLKDGAPAQVLVTGRTYKWDSASVAADDGATVIKLTITAGAGRFLVTGSEAADVSTYVLRTTGGGAAVANLVATDYVSVGAAPPVAGLVRLDGAATINAGTSIALQVLGTAVITAAASLVTLAQPLAIGATPAATGAVRLTENQFVISRKAGGGGDVSLVGLDSANDTVTIGAAATYDSLVRGANVNVTAVTAASLLVGVSGITVTAASIATSLAIEAAQPITVTRNGLGTTPTPAYTAANTTPATAGVPVQCGPSWNSLTHVWDSDKGGGGADATVDGRLRVLPVSGTAPYGILSYGTSIDGGAFSETMRTHSTVSAAYLYLLNTIVVSNTTTATYVDGTSFIYLRHSGTVSATFSPANAMSLLVAGVASALTVGDRLRNSTAATNTVEQFSPARALEHYAWNTGGAPASEKWELFEQGRSIQGNPSIGYWVWSSKRASGTEVAMFNLVNDNGTPLAQVGSVLGNHSQWGLAGMQQSTKTAGSGVAFLIRGQEATEVAAVTAGHVGVIAGNATGAGSIGGSAYLQAGSGVAANGEAYLIGASGSKVVSVGTDLLAFFDGTKRARPSLAGSLSLVTDANAKAVLESMAAALGEAVGLKLWDRTTLT